MTEETENKSTETTPDSTPPVSSVVNTEETSLSINETTPRFGRRLALSNVSRTLTDIELNDSGTKKLLLGILEELDNENIELKYFKEKFHIADKDKAVMEVKLKEKKAITFFVDSVTALGGIITGLSGYFFKIDQPAIAGLAIIIGLVMIVIGNIYKRIKD